MKRTVKVPEIKSAKRARAARRKQRRAEIAADRYYEYLQEVCEPIDIYGFC